MKLFSHATAPNPRRVHIYLAEKGIDVPCVAVDMQKGEHKSAEFMAKNLNGQIPVLELDDGTCISESISICRYFEALYPEESLFGSTPVEIGIIDMHLRRIELGLGRQVSTSWVNGPVVAKIAKGRFVQIPEARVQSDAAVRAYYQRLDGELSSRPMVAGASYTVADIAALVTIDFASLMVDLKPDESLHNLARWHAEVSARPSSNPVMKWIEN